MSLPAIVRNRFWPLREIGSVADLAVFARVASFAAIVPVIMRLPLPMVAALLERASRPRPRGNQVSPEQLSRFVEVASVLAGPVVKTGCLTRGVTMYRFLRRSGMDVDLCFGIDPELGHAADGHCWLALNGEPYLEKVDPRERFAEVYRLPLAAA